MCTGRPAAEQTDGWRRRWRGRSTPLMGGVLLAYCCRRCERGATAACAGGRVRAAAWECRDGVGCGRMDPMPPAASPSRGVAIAMPVGSVCVCACVRVYCVCCVCPDDDVCVCPSAPESIRCVSAVFPCVADERVPFEVWRAESSGGACCRWAVASKRCEDLIASKKPGKRADSATLEC